MSDGDGEVHRADDIGKGEGSKLSGRQIGAIAIGAVIVLFAVLNLDEVKVDLAVTSVHMRLFIVIAVSAALGFGGGLLVARHRARKDD
jgi:ABC-type glucose/galactose transport system permease subunit